LVLRKLYSTENGTVKPVNNKLQALLGILFVEKAFDYINYGILGELWFASCFANRRLKMKTPPLNTVENFFVKWGTVKHTVLEGSVLGHLLFIIFYNKHVLRTHNIC
jgi:hypothetical protein